jgi:hypothetical protein
MENGSPKTIILHRNQNKENQRAQLHKKSHQESSHPKQTGGGEGGGDNNPPALWVTEEYQIKMEATSQSQECKASSLKKASET